MNIWTVNFGGHWSGRGVCKIVAYRVLHIGFLMLNLNKKFWKPQSTFKDILFRFDGNNSLISSTLSGKSNLLHWLMDSVLYLNLTWDNATTYAFLPLLSNLGHIRCDFTCCLVVCPCQLPPPLNLHKYILITFIF